MKKYTVYTNIITTLLLIGFAVGMQACKEGKKSPQKEIKFSSRGGVLEVLLVIDSAKWNGVVGQTLKEIFASPLPGLPRSEKDFKLLHIDPHDFGRFLKRHHNLLMVTLLNDNSRSGKRMQSYFTKETLAKIKKDPDVFMIGKSDEYAVGQKVLYLFGRNDTEIAENILKNKDNLKEYFYRVERKRMLKRLLGAGASTQEKLGDLIYEESGLRIKIPSGFQKAKIDSNFIWLRRVGKPYDKSILITYGNYSSQDMFKDSSLVKWRDFFGYKYMNNNDTTRAPSYMTTQDYIPVESKNVNINGLYVKEYRGLWKTTNNTRGGPFLGYAFADEEQGRFYYIEGFIYAPNEKQRKQMFELESILHSFTLK